MQANCYEIKRIEFDGIEYGVEKREAKVGESVIYMYNGKTDGVVSEVTEVGAGSVTIAEYVSEDEDGDDVTVSSFEHGAYRILVPQASTKPDVLELIANLAQTVAKQQREIGRLKYANDILSDRVDSITDDIRTFAEDLTELGEKSQESEVAEAIAKLVEKGYRIDVRI